MLTEAQSRLLVDYTSWDALAERVRSQQDLDEALRARALAAIPRLRRWLGERWLHDIASADGELGMTFVFNRAP